VNNEELNKEVRELLKQSVAPVQDPDLRRDLWPRMLRKLDERPLPLNSVPWFDWLLASFAAAVLLFFPGIIPALFYHL
jgi:hypothetical protein